MSQNFSAEQYQYHYVPKKIGNWEVPKKFRKHPRTFEGFTHPVTDLNGHFLPDVQKPPFEEWSWNNTTWDRGYYSRPDVIEGTEVDPGMWIVEAGKGYWIEAPMYKRQPQRSGPQNSGQQSSGPQNSVQPNSKGRRQN